MALQKNPGDWLKASSYAELVPRPLAEAGLKMSAVHQREEVQVVVVLGQSGSDSGKANLSVEQPRLGFLYAPWEALRNPQADRSKRKHFQRWQKSRLVQDEWSLREEEEGQQKQLLLVSSAAVEAHTGSYMVPWSLVELNKEML